jgi:hypothetical protein
MPLDGADWLRPLAYPNLYSLGEQSEARAKLQAVFGDSEAELDRKRRQRERSPVESVIEGTDHARPEA